MKYLFAVNPVSGKNKALKKMNKLAQYLKEHHYDFMCYQTQPYHYADDLRAVINENQITHVFAVGGDGTAHEVLNAIVDLDVFFGVIPFGSGNDFARLLKLPKKIKHVFDMIENNKIKTIDIGKVENRYFLNYISFGFDVAILQKSIKYKKFLHSGLAYALAVVTTLITYKCETSRINGEKSLLYLTTIHNGKYYGGGMKINPFSEVDDGKLDLCTVKKINRFKLLFLFPSVFFGKHDKFKKIVHFEQNEAFSVETKDLKTDCGIDGEIYQLTSPIKIGIIPNKIKMIYY